MADGLLVEGLSKLYPNGTRALDDVSLAAEAGTFLVLLGPSGSGKTTMLRILAGIERASSGHVWVGDRLVSRPGVHVPPERRNLSMVFQDYALWPHMSARDNVAFALRRQGLSTDARRGRALSMLARVGLGRLAERFPGQLSGGEQQRVALARALVAGTGMVLCDEPLSNLDADLRERLRVEVSTLVRESGTTAVYITHDQSEAFALADRVGVLDHGRLVQLGTPEDVYRWPATPFVARFTGSAGELAVEISGLAGVGDSVSVCPVGVRANRPITARRVGRPGRYGQLIVRPAAVRVCEASDPEAHTYGTVADVAFRGRGYELVVDVGGGRRIGNVACALRLARGERVGLQFDPEGSVVYPDTAMAELNQELTSERA